MSPRFQHILIIADIEGSSGCFSYRASSFLTPEWARACADMTRDVSAVVSSLFEAGAETVAVKDFHRTGYNLLPEWIDSRAEWIPGYRQGPVPGLGEPGRAQGIVFLGLHAASGTDGFLAHTMTSRLKDLKVNGRILTEAELFSASLAPYGLRPLFFSGCPTACSQAEAALPGLQTLAIDKSGG
ncbi:MAG: M55 family metallopeptidase, partial [Proteobacteria bacterium]|nr:M55 family metallopeptidase [Pseudomonadota bacterium]